MMLREREKGRKESIKEGRKNRKIRCIEMYNNVKRIGINE